MLDCVKSWLTIWDYERGRFHLQKIRCLCIRNEYLTTDFNALAELGCTHINMGTSYFLLSDYTTTKQRVQACLEKLETTNLKLLARPEPFMENGLSISPGDESFLTRNAEVCSNLLQETEIEGITFNDFSYNQDIYDNTQRAQSTIDVTNAAQFYKEHFHDVEPKKLFGSFTSYGYTKGFEPSLIVPFLDMVFPEIYRITYTPERTLKWLGDTLDYFLGLINGYSGLIVPTCITYDSDDTHNIRIKDDIVSDAVEFLKRDIDGYCYFLNKYKPLGLYYPYRYLSGRVWSRKPKRTN